jgi:hypothetical protein
MQIQTFSRQIVVGILMFKQIFITQVSMSYVVASVDVSYSFSPAQMINISPFW